jgi:hypothetical protein
MEKGENREELGFKGLEQTWLTGNPKKSGLIAAGARVRLGYARRGRKVGHCSMGPTCQCLPTWGLRVSDREERRGRLLGRSRVGREKEEEDGAGWLGFGSWAGLLATRPRRKGREVGLQQKKKKKGKGLGLRAKV